MMKLKTLSVLPLISIGVMACVPDASDAWIEVDPRTATSAIDAVKTVVDEPLTVTQTFTWIHQGTLVCGTAGEQKISYYVDEAGRVVTEELPVNPCD